VSASLSEAEAHWRDFLAGLQARGLHGVRMVASDAHAGLKEALAARLTGVPWQRRQFHLMHNAMAHVPRPGMRKEVAASLRAVFDAPGRAEAERQLDLAVRKYRGKAPRLAEWLRQEMVFIDSGLDVSSLQKRLASCLLSEAELVDRRDAAWTTHSLRGRFTKSDRLELVRNEADGGPGKPWSRARICTRRRRTMGGRSIRLDRWNPSRDCGTLMVSRYCSTPTLGHA
jgi:hypothetical protein